MRTLSAELLRAAAALQARAHATTTLPYPKDGDAIDGSSRKSGKGASIAMGEPGCFVVQSLPIKHEMAIVFDLPIMGNFIVDLESLVKEGRAQ